MVESYLHKTAKELLYKEIEEKSCFEYKLSNGTTGFESLISREDYRNECVLMEFPTKEGYYPDEFGCCKKIIHFDCKYCKWNDGCMFDHIGSPDDPCGGYMTDYTLKCHKSTKCFRFNKGDGYCKCSTCEDFNFNDSIVHDIAAFWKGNVRWAIEIINKHEPDWIEAYASMPYPIYFVRAEDALKRVESTPTFVYKVVWTSDPK
ncbi:MAG: hypothetical protein KAR20_10735 [Candidatus Heimdallarchaeota archaeon]|nr:hypothetical protein [Candidatus Heimdallarchaeota archaeon]